MRTFTISAIAALALSAAAGHLLAGDVGPLGVGFRGDGTGVYPGSRPPIEWSDAKNVRWKAPLPNWGYACPVPVSGRVLMVTEPGWKSVWPELNCFDADTGEPLWRVPVNPLDAFPELSKEERESLTADIAWVHDGFRAAYRICRPLEEKGRVAEDDPLMGEVNAKLAPFGISVASYTRGYGLLRKMKYLDDRRRQVDRRLGRYGIVAETTWQRFGSARMGVGFPTPVSDGEFVYVMTNHGTVACFDLEGRLRWSQHSGYKIPAHTTVMASPRLYEGLLLTGFICHGQAATLLAWDKATGERKWQVDITGGKPVLEDYQSRSGGSLVVMTIGKTPVVLCSSGRVVRLPDGKMYEAGIPAYLSTVAVDDEHDAIFSVGSCDRRTLRWGCDLRIDGDELKCTPRYVLPGNGAASPVFVDGRLIDNRAQIDPKTGAYLGVDPSVTDTRKVPQTAPQTRHVLLVAGGHVYGLRQQNAPKGAEGEAFPTGVCEVFTLDGKKVAENVLSSGPWDADQEARLQQQGFGKDFSYACSMNIGGNRIYIASQDYLFCIGE